MTTPRSTQSKYSLVLCLISQCMNSISISVTIQRININLADLPLTRFAIRRHMHAFHTTHNMQLNCINNPDPYPIVWFFFEENGLLIPGIYKHILPDKLPQSCTSTKCATCHHLNCQQDVPYIANVKHCEEPENTNKDTYFGPTKTLSTPNSQKTMNQHLTRMKQLLGVKMIADGLHFNMAKLTHLKPTAPAREGLGAKVV